MKKRFKMLFFAIVIALAIMQLTLLADTVSNIGWPTSNPNISFALVGSAMNEPWNSNIRTATASWHNHVQFNLNATTTAGPLANNVSVTHVSNNYYGWITGELHDNGRHMRNFQIFLNNFRIQNRDAVIRSVMAHELGHVLWLADTSYANSIMNTNRDRTRLTAPTTRDINIVRSVFNSGARIEDELYVCAYTSPSYVLDRPNKMFFSADSPYFASVESLISDTANIVRGRVIDSRVEYLDILTTNCIPFTITTFFVEDSYRGGLSDGHYIEVIQPGGQTENTILKPSSFTSFSEAGEYVLFLSADTSQMHFLSSPTQAAYIYNPHARSPFDMLESVCSYNSLTLTYDDILQAE